MAHLSNGLIGISGFSRVGAASPLTRKAHPGDYSTRMHRVLEYIDRHLDETLELQSLARVAHFSAFHFHRIFFAWTGETLGAYLRRRRLEIAASRLAGQPKLTILS